MTRAKWWNTCIVSQSLGTFISPVRDEEKPSQGRLWIWFTAAWQVLSSSQFLTRRLHIRKTARDPSGERWNFLSRRLSCNFAKMTAFYAIQVYVSCSPNLYLYKLLCFVSECSTGSLSLPCMRLDHDSGQVMKFVYMRTTCSVSILNKWLKLELNLLKQQVFILLSLYIICVENEFEAFDATSDEIRLMAFYLNPDIIVVSLKTSLSTSDEIRIITNVLVLTVQKMSYKHDFLQWTDVLP